MNGASPLTMIVAGTDPTPMKTRKAVPKASRASFWVRERLVHDVSPEIWVEAGCRLVVDYLGYHSIMSNVIWNIRLCFGHHKGRFRRKVDG